MSREPSVILAGKKYDVKVDISQIKNVLADIDRRRKDELAEHRKQMSALDKEEVVQRKALIKASAKDK